jgi:hypothetical protein
MLSTQTLYTPTKIQYVVFVKHVPQEYPAANFVLEYSILTHLRYFPIDLLQFIERFDYFDHVKQRDSGGLQVLFLPIDDIMKPGQAVRHLSVLKMQDRVVVFLFSSECIAYVNSILKEVHTIKL